MGKIRFGFPAHLLEQLASHDEVEPFRRRNIAATGREFAYSIVLPVERRAQTKR